MKKVLMFVVLFVTFLSVKSQDLMNIKPTGYVNDYENIFTPEQKADLEHILSDYEKKTSIEFFIVTYSDYFSIDPVALARKWGIGKKGLNNGLLMFLSKEKRKYANLTGYGLEGLLPDATLHTFESDIYPRTLSKGLFYEGMKEFILACQDQIGQEGYDMLIKNKQLKEDQLAGVGKMIEIPRYARNDPSKTTATHSPEVNRTAQELPLSALQP